jgi:hypothetical protein
MQISAHASEIEAWSYVQNRLSRNDRYSTLLILKAKIKLFQLMNYIPNNYPQQHNINVIEQDAYFKK